MSPDRICSCPAALHDKNDTSKQVGIVLLSVKLLFKQMQKPQSEIEVRRFDSVGSVRVHFNFNNWISHVICRHYRPIIRTIKKVGETGTWLLFETFKLYHYFYKTILQVSKYKLKVSNFCSKNCEWLTLVFRRQRDRVGSASYNKNSTVHESAKKMV